MIDIEAYLRDRKELVEATLQDVLPKSPAIPEDLSAAMHHAVWTGGKRIRPILCLAAADAIGAQSESTRYAAAAIELLHTYTLVHDDLPCMDNDTERRGKPTVWAKFGESLAVLTGDALQALAFDVVTRVKIHPIATLKALTNAAGPAGVIAGQIADINAVTPNAKPWDMKLMNYIFSHKTGDLFLAAMLMGAITARATAAQLRDIGAYAVRLGVAFQIVDDLLDGAQAAADAEFSCLGVMSETEARDLAKNLTTQACAALDELPGETEPLRALAQQLLKRIV